MDVTSVFLQQVSASKKFEGSWNEKKVNGSSILKPIQKRLPFVATAAEISKNIKGLQDFLNEHKSAYLDTSSKYISASSSMSEDQKDEIDKDVMTTMEKCKNGINSLQHTLVEFKKRGTVDGDLMAHLIGILDILQQSLSETANTFKKFKRERLKKKMQEAEGFFKLDSLKAKQALSPMTRRTIGIIKTQSSPNMNNDNSPKFPPKSKTGKLFGEDDGSEQRIGSRSRSNSFGNSSGGRSRSNSKSSASTSPQGTRSPSPVTTQTNHTNNNTANNKHVSTASTKTSSSSSLGSSDMKTSGNMKNWLSDNRSDFNTSTELLDSFGEDDSDDDMQLEESERKLFDEENLTLQRELDTMVDQMRVIDTQLASVSSLFDELVGHIADQKDSLEVINDLATAATNYVQKGNVQLAIATKRTVDFRLMVLLFLIICSISLLFLHWYEQ